MGCDFFFKGNLLDVILQEKVIDFVKDYFGKIDLMIVPNLSQSYLTKIELPRVEHEYTCREIVQEDYPFNFFGFIPLIDEEYGISDAGQFVFNRNDNGRLVQIRRLPESFGILPHRYYQEEQIAAVAAPVSVTIPENSSPHKVSTSPSTILDSDLIPIEPPTLQKAAESQPSQESRPQYEIVIDDGGYHRMGGGMGFALLLTICKLRWWPDLKMGDDYENCETVAALIAKWEMKEILKDEALDFPACSQLFNTAYEMDFPSPPDAEEIPVTTPCFFDFEQKEKIFLESELCTRTNNILKQSGITTIDNLLTKSYDELFRMNNLGKKAANEIKTVLIDLGLLLRDSTDEFEITEDCVKCITISPSKNIGPLLQWYLDFNAKINPYLKAGKELFDS